MLDFFTNKKGVNMTKKITREDILKKIKEENVKLDIHT